MERRNGQLAFSPSDLNDFLECEHLTGLELAVARGELVRAAVDNPQAELIRRKGEEHEAAHLAALETDGRQVVRIGLDDDWEVRCSALRRRPSGSLCAAAEAERDGGGGGGDARLGFRASRARRRAPCSTASGASPRSQRPAPSGGERCRESAPTGRAPSRRRSVGITTSRTSGRPAEDPGCEQEAVEACQVPPLSNVTLLTLDKSVSLPEQTQHLKEPGEPVGRGHLVRRRWQAQFAGLGGRRGRQGFEYQAYVPMPIAEEDFALTTQIAAAAANAEAAIRDLNDNPPALLNLETLARQLLRAESVASSRIEGLILSHRRLAHAAFAPGHDVTAQSVLRNIEALERAVDIAGRSEEITTAHIVDVHRELFTGTRDERLAGVIREEQNWIGGDATSPRTAAFVPPPQEYVRPLLDDLSSFLNRDDVPAVIQAAIAHVQFETIHPFADGNGRIGRALILVVLRRRGTALRYLPPVSLALAGRADRYVNGLTSWRLSTDGADWLQLFADAVWRASTGAREFAETVAALQARWVSQAGRPRQRSSPLRLIELLPSNPVVNVRSVAELLGSSGEAARLAIRRLEEAKILRQVTIGRRNRAWETVGLFDLLDRFERELGPRSRTPRPTR